MGEIFFKNPFAFEKEPKESKEQGSKEYLALQEQNGEALPHSITGLHRFFKFYIKGFHGAGELKNQLMKCVHFLMDLENSVNVTGEVR